MNRKGEEMKEKRNSSGLLEGRGWGLKLGLRIFRVGAGAGPGPSPTLAHYHP